jgi:hypothetical protein
MEGGQIGRSVPRLKAREKVTGRAEYTHLTISLKRTSPNTVVN